jgi:hypothetical protein
LITNTWKRSKKSKTRKTSKTSFFCF